VKVQRDNLKNTRGDTTKIYKCFDCIGTFLDQPLYRSYWLENLCETPFVEPLRSSARCDEAIIGGGFTGLSTAYNTRMLLPGADVRRLEANICGFGSSGRNGGFSSTLFCMSKSLMARMFGKGQAIAAHHYMENAVDYVVQIVREHVGRHRSMG